jgi:hypothetical protein
MRADERVRITSPAPLATVATPFTLRWEADASVGVRFAVFVDQTPFAKGAALSDLAPDSCKDKPPCPDDTYLRRRGVYVVDGNEATIGQLPPSPNADAEGPHPIRKFTVVALDDTGRRVTDGAWKVEIHV